MESIGKLTQLVADVEWQQRHATNAVRPATRRTEDAQLGAAIAITLPFEPHRDLGRIVRAFIRAPRADPVLRSRAGQVGSADTS